MVWPGRSRLQTVMVSPALTVSLVGEKAKFLISTLFPVVTEGFGEREPGVLVILAVCEQPARKTAKVSRTAVFLNI